MPSRTKNTTAAAAAAIASHNNNNNNNNNSSMDDSDREENELLLAPATKAKRAMNQIHAATTGIFWNRIVLFLLLAAFVTFGLFSESQIMVLQTKLADTEQQVEALQDLTAEHEKVIERFSESITNEDVLKRLSVLEQNMTDTESYLRLALQKNADVIQTRLDQESKELQDQVNAAELQIHNKVAAVEDDIRSYYIETKAQFSMENSFMVYQLAGTFTLLSCLISMWHMTAHLRKLNQPMVQRKILAILWMSPVYAITSWFSLVFPKAEGYLAIIKDGYEAYIIYQFLSFCIAVIGKGDRNKVVDILAAHADHLTPPFKLTALCELCGFCKPPPNEDKRQLADEILLQCQFFALQFVFFRPLTTTAMVFLNQFQYYGGGEGPMDYRAPQLYLTVIQNISIFVAFTGLLKFYHAVDNELAWCRPLPKFLCIKGVVFMTFWQGLAIAVLAEETSKDDSNAENWADSAQNFLICLEMLLFSIAHFYCFPTEEWQDGYRVQVDKGKFGDSLALGDFFSDIKLILRNNKRKTPKKKGKSTRKLGETDPIPEAPEPHERSGRTASSGTAEEDILLRALNDSLGDDAADPEIAKATRRLLKSNVLSPDFFGSTHSMQASPTNTDIENARRQLYGSQGDDDFDHDEDEEEETDEDDDDDEENDVERVDSTSHGGDGSNHLSPFMEALRPSIFTTAASLAEMERRAAEQMDKSKPAAAVQKTDEAKPVVVDPESNNDVDEWNYVPVFVRQSCNDQSESPFLEALRPSIFTTVASLAEMERKAARSSQSSVVPMEGHVVVYDLKPFAALVGDELNRAENDAVDESFETTVQTENDLGGESDHALAQVADESNEGIVVMGSLNQAIIHPVHDLMGTVNQTNVDPGNTVVYESSQSIVHTTDESHQADVQLEHDTVQQDFSIVETHFSETH